MAMQTCRLCGECKGVDEFYQRSDGRRDSRCKPCARAQAASRRASDGYRQWLAESREARKERRRKYRREAGAKPWYERWEHDSHVRAWRSHVERKQKQDKEKARLFFWSLGMKHCPGCNALCGHHHFAKSRRSADGLLRICKDCDSKRTKENRAKNRERYLERKRQYYAANRDKFAEMARRRKERNPEKVREMRRRQAADPMFKLKQNIRKAIRDSFKKGGYTKRSRACEILGCEFDAFVRHIERQFVRGMSWDKMGREIHIDHIVPLATAKTEEDVIALNHFTNLRPCWADENLQKSDRLEFLL